MGTCFSCNSTSILKNIRVVHINGYVEDFEEPISVRQVIGYPSKHFLCTSTLLLSTSSKPMNGNTHLQPGQVYFMLPYSVLQADVSPVDLTGLVKRLSAIAKASPLSSQNQTVWCSPSRSPSKAGAAEQYGVGKMNIGGRSPCKVQSWKPILDTISEKPYNRRSESDWQESY
ncbi:hypothetical protein PHAVU_003G142300 [Phaseolus vulgaris]|uniref:DUF4228 domain-containing protein n=1 Tax=Phaseolus vulgaris TaxID=3885 RepID=V7CBS9_PHAVU|nr:hypothetical protein PHAVU_003G142300g [Phaseolus vulgaris]ESW26720.1 hypothetical protein PHAVU_003G142300g [Phaseolus vulgaris]